MTKYLLIIFAFFLSACVESKDIDLTYEVKKSSDGRFSGVLLLEAKNLHAKSDDPKKAETELNHFIKDELPGIAAELAEDFALMKYDLKTTNNEDGVNASLTGKFKYLTAALMPLISEKEYTVEMKNGQLSVRFLIDRNSGIEEEQDLIIKYDGRIISSNAHEWDKEGGILKWKLNRVGQNGIAFVLK